MTSWLYSWKFDPSVPILACLGILYLSAARQARKREAWNSARILCFFIGLGSAALVTTSAIGVYADTLFWARAVQTVTLLMVSPLWISLGAPLTLLARAASPGMKNRMRRWRRSKASQLATFPLVVTVLFIAPPFLLYLTPLYQLCLENSLVDQLTHLILLLCGFFYFWTRLGIDPTPREKSYLASLWISLTEVIFDGILGLVVWFGPLIAADHYQALARTWGPDLRLDQIIGAGVLWIGGDLAGLPFIGALFVHWARDDRRRAQEIDTELDEQERASSTVNSAKDAPQLWWESDPVLSQRFRSR